jgi:imidazolonepropionase
VQVAVELGAASADHCTHLDDADIEALAGSATVATLLPAAEFSTRSPYPDARRLLDAGATVALAADCNPGSSYTTSMPFCIALAVREMRMTPGEALRAATLGGARALRRDDVGHLGLGARGDLVVLDAPSHLHLAYRPGVPIVAAVARDGGLVGRAPLVDVEPWEIS